MASLKSLVKTLLNAYRTKLADWYGWMAFPYRDKVVSITPVLNTQTNEFVAPFDGYFQFSSSSETFYGFDAWNVTSGLRYSIGIGQAGRYASFIPACKGNTIRFWIYDTVGNSSTVCEFIGSKGVSVVGS